MPVKKRTQKSWVMLLTNPQTTVSTEKPNTPRRITCFLPKRSEIRPAMIGMNMFPTERQTQPAREMSCQRRRPA